MQILSRILKSKLLQGILSAAVILGSGAAAYGQATSNQESPAGASDSTPAAEVAPEAQDPALTSTQSPLPLPPAPPAGFVMGEDDDEDDEDGEGEDGEDDGEHEESNDND